MPAIYYHPEAFSITGPKLMGRNAAGESFLRGFLKYSKSNEFWAQVEQAEHAIDFAKKVRDSGRTEPVKSVNRSSIQALSKSEVLFYPGPDIGQQALHRSLHGNGLWSLCGITHTTSSARAMDSISNLLTSPVYPWDALICTSQTVKKNVENVLQAQINYLKDRLGITKFISPQLPVIPLGIHTSDFNFSKEDRSVSRKKLGIKNETLVVMYMGRLSFHAKAHPIAMYQALEKAAERTKKEVILIECGWHANDSIEKIYKETSSSICPNIRVINLDGREANQRKIAWSSADIFCSLSDNIQETFGIVPIEAMAAGIPVVVSDWDGYKDTVRNGIDGFKSPTSMPQSGLGSDLAFRHSAGIDTYDMYCGLTCSLIAVDIEATANAFEKLFLSESLRIQLGQAGKRRASEEYDWKVIIKKYEELWFQLNEIRSKTAAEIKPMKYPWPARMDPFHAFKSYPTKTISNETKVEKIDQEIEIAINKALMMRNSKMLNFAQYVLPSEEEIKLILNSIGQGSNSVKDVIKTAAKERQPYLARSVGWLLKIGILRIID